MPRPGIFHSEPSKYFFPRFSSISAGFFFLSAFLSLASPLRADQTVYSASTQTNSLDNGNEAARSAAMGSAFTGVADDASALFSNPAGLGFLNQGQLFLNSDLWLVGTFQETALAAFPAGGAGGLAFAAHYLDYGQMEGRDALGSLTASYSADRLGLEAGWGYELVKNLSLGLGVGGSQTNLAGTNYTHFTSNLGVLWRDGRGLRLGASYLNTGWISPGGASEDAVNLGASYEWVLNRTDRLLVAAGGALEPGAVDYVQAGAEYSLQGLVFLRVGCEAPLSDQSLGGFADLTAGVGLHLSGFSLDYAFLPYGDLGAAHRVSLGYFFDSGKKKSPASAGLPASPGNNPAGLAGRNNGLSGAAGSSGPGGLPTSPLPALPGFLPLFPDNKSSAPSQAAGAVTLSNPTATASQPRAVTESGAKDSLVVQFDLADNSAPSGAELEKQGKPQEALLAYREAVRQTPQDPNAWWALGNFYRETNQKAYAIQCFEQVLKLQPANQKLADWLAQYRLSNP